MRFKGPQAPPDLPVAPGAGPLQPGGEAFFQGVLPRPEDEPGSWGHRQIGRCLRAFETQVTEEKVDTDGLGIGQAAEKIGALCGLALAEDKRGPVRRGLGRLATQIRHIR